MASIANEQDPEQQPGQQPAAGAPVAVGGTAGASSTGGQGNSGANGVGGAAPVSPVSANTAPRADSGYIDVGTYLDANKSGSQQLGKQVASNLTDQYNTTKSGIDSSAQGTQNLADQGYTHENSDLINHAASDPAAVAATAGNGAAVQAQLKDTYTGPTNWADYGTQQGKVAAAQQEGALASTPGGLNVLAGQAEGGTSSQGVNQLDTLFLGAPEAAGAVKAASDPFNTLGTYLDSKNMDVTGAITGAQNNAATAKAHAQDAFFGNNGAYTNLTNAVNTQKSDAIAKAQAQQAQLKADLGNLYGGQAVDTTATTLGGYKGTQHPWVNTTNYTVGQLSPQDLASLGITQDQWNQLQGSMQQAGTTKNYTGHNFGAGSGTSQIDVSQWLNQLDPSTAVTASNVATPEQAQRLAALQSLLGDQTPANGLTLDPTQAGKFNPASLSNFDYAGALGNSQQVAAEQAKAAQDEANSLGSSADAQHNAEKHKGVLNTIKNAINQPGKALALDPRDTVQTFNKAKKGQDPLGSDPLPSKDELAKLGIKI